MPLMELCYMTKYSLVEGQGNFMSLQLLVGRSGSGKSFQLYSEIIKKSMENEAYNYLVIVPEQFTMQTQKDMVSLHPNKGTMNIDVLSFMRLAYRIFDEMGGSTRPVLDDTGKSMVLRKIVDRKKKELELFHHDVKKQGFINELKSMISEVYQYSITLPMLEEMEQKVDKPMLKSKLHDLILIYEGFRQYLSYHYITAEEILEVLCDVVLESQLIAKSVLCFDGFTGFTPAQYKLLNLLMKKAKKVIITITIDQEELQKKEDEFSLFHLSRKTINRLLDLATSGNVSVDPFVFTDTYTGRKSPYRFRNSKALASLEKNLFQFPAEEFMEEQNHITIHVMRDCKKEAAFVVHEIRELVRNNKYRYHEIAIVSGDVSTYGRLLGREFDKVGIPCFVDQKRDVMSNPFVELLRSALDIVWKNFDFESIVRYLRCGLLDLPMDDVDLLENYILAMGIKGQSLWSIEWDRSYRGQKKGELLRINKIRSMAYDSLLPLYIALSDKKKNVQEWTMALYEFGHKLHVPEKLEKFAMEFKEKKQLSKAKEYHQIYSIVMELYDKFVELLGDEVLSLKEYIEILDAGLSETKVGLIPPGMDQVVVGDIERTRLKDIKVLFFMGINDTMIPKNHGTGGIFSEMERQILVDHNLEMAPTKRQAAFTEKFYLYLNLTKPQERLYLTYSKLAEDGKSIRPSYLVETIKNLFPSLKVRDEDKIENTLSSVLSRNNGFDHLIEEMKKYPDQEMSEYSFELYQYYNSKEEYKNRIKYLVQGVNYINKEHGISKRVAMELYGAHLVGSASRFEGFESCAFAHYLSYGLELRERMEYRLAIPDIGNLFHNAMELFARKLAERGQTWHTISEELREELGSQCVNEVASDYGNQIFKSSKRYGYIINRVERITKRTIWAISEQIKRGDFEPIGFEVQFSDYDQLESLQFSLSKEESVHLQGRIDRLDVCQEADHLMIGIVDYKSGNTSFDLESVYYGLQVQLPLYLTAAVELMEKEHQDKTVIPAGMFYYNLKDPIVEKVENVEEAILKKLKLNGLVNQHPQILGHFDRGLQGEAGGMMPSVKSSVIPVDTGKDGLPNKRSKVADLESITAMEDYVKDGLFQAGRRILDGDTKIAPYQLDKKTACDYCMYKSVCGFDTGVSGYAYRKLPTIGKEEVLQKFLEKKLQKEEKKHEMDTRTTEGN